MRIFFRIVCVMMLIWVGCWFVTWIGRVVLVLALEEIENGILPQQKKRDHQ